MSELFTLQKAFTEHLRNPDFVPVPEGLDPRRVGIYSELIFSNLSALLRDFFPVIKSILSDDQWHQLVRDFFISHQAETPYFPQVSEEFVHYLSGRQHTSGTPDFLLELAHYEWVELYLYMHSDEPPPNPIPETDLAMAPLTLSPVVSPLAYEYPVHLIREDFQPEAPGDEPTFLLVFRNKEESIEFYELQSFTFQLLEAIEENPGLIASDWLNSMAEQAAVADKATFIENGINMLQQFNSQCVFMTK
jgi:hypothetical protein